MTFGTGVENFDNNLHDGVADIAHMLRPRDRRPSMIKPLHGETSIW